ncbi:MAG TPA: phosphocholine cytidylyltransferase family protein [Terracidiphilus sp.]|jgi:choline kinase|nr:phosphocholine cytidylyltransferase family protein [Terracidiphilus sp.]
MKAILLAAGRGTRISRSIDGKPKCMLMLDEDTRLIEYTTDLLHANGIADVILVLGYQSRVIRETLATRHVRFIENHFFDCTNSIASLWFARSELDGYDDCLVMNGDVFLSEQAIDAVLAEKESPVLFYDTSRCEDADYRFQCEGDRLVNYGKHLSLGDTSGEYIGCARLDRAFVPAFLSRLDQLIGSQQHGKWWEDVLYSFSSERKIIARDIGGAFWGEVDYIEDYTRIMTFYKALSRETGRVAMTL